MLQEKHNQQKSNHNKIEESLKNLYISLKYKIGLEDKKKNMNDYFKAEFDRLEKVDLAILMDYLNEMIDIYADYKTDKALFETNQKLRDDENIYKLDGSKNDIERLIEEDGFECLTIKYENPKKSIENSKFKDYFQYEKIIKKLEAEIRNRIQVRFIKEFLFLFS